MTKAAVTAGAVLALLAVFATLSVTALTALTSSTGGSSPSAAALNDIPPDYLTLYTHAAASCPGLNWTVLAAIGKTETDHGRSTAPGVTSGENSAGAGGPMQFLQPSFDTIVARHGLPPGGAHPPSRYNPHDAIHAAASYLCDHGAPAEIRTALFAYNHSTHYVTTVLDRAASYGSVEPGEPGGSDEPGWGVLTQWPTENATLPDPSGTGGRVTPRLNTLYQALHAGGALGGGGSCWDPHPQNPDSDHPRGRACDIFFDPHDGAQVARGWELARWLTTAQPAYGIRYLIWQGRIWTTTSPTWDTYHSNIYHCPDPANLTGCHYNHIHISVY